MWDFKDSHFFANLYTKFIQRATSKYVHTYMPESDKKLLLNLSWIESNNVPDHK